MVYIERMRYRITNFYENLLFSTGWNLYGIHLHLAYSWNHLCLWLYKARFLCYFEVLWSTPPSLYRGFTKHTSHMFMATFFFDFVASLSTLSCSVATHLYSMFCAYVALFSWLCNECTRDTFHSLQCISLTTSHWLPTLC